MLGAQSGARQLRLPDPASQVAARSLHLRSLRALTKVDIRPLEKDKGQHKFTCAMLNSHAREMVKPGKVQGVMGGRKKGRKGRKKEGRKEGRKKERKKERKQERKKETKKERKKERKKGRKLES